MDEICPDCLGQGVVLEKIDVDDFREMPCHCVKDDEPMDEDDDSLL
jgi:hypothetical protein